jgi:hypothetical protein
MYIRLYIRIYIQTNNVFAVCARMDMYTCKCVCVCVCMCV